MAEGTFSTRTAIPNGRAQPLLAFSGKASIREHSQAGFSLLLASGSGLEPAGFLTRWVRGPCLSSPGEATKASLGLLIGRHFAHSQHVAPQLFFCPNYQKALLPSQAPGTQPAPWALRWGGPGRNKAVLGSALTALASRGQQASAGGRPRPALPRGLPEAGLIW